MHDWLKRSIRSVAVQAPEHSVLVASMGRSGSTMLHAAAVDTMRHGRRSRLGTPLPRGLFTEDAWDLRRTRFQKGVVYKTHDYPNEVELPGFLRVVYLFGDPFEVVCSMLSGTHRVGLGWARAHFAHLRADFSEFDRVLETDAMGLASHYQAWVAPQRFRLLSVKYDALWDRTPEIADFLQLPLRLPPRRARKSSLDLVPAGARETFEQTYAALAAAVAAAPDFAIWEPIA